MTCDEIFWNFSNKTFKAFSEIFKSLFCVAFMYILGTVSYQTHSFGFGFPIYKNCLFDYFVFASNTCAHKEKAQTLR